MYKQAKVIGTWIYRLETTKIKKPDIRRKAKPKALIPVIAPVTAVTSILQESPGVVLHWTYAILNVLSLYKIQIMTSPYVQAHT
jgi:hypothetical protein